jgi:hypothetical protein
MSGDEKLVHLTVNEILELAGLVNREREKLLRMIEQHPSEKSSNAQREAHVSRLDMLTSKLMTQIG